jgi:hypothetical protein
VRRVLCLLLSVVLLDLHKEPSEIKLLFVVVLKRELGGERGRERENE